MNPLPTYLSLLQYLKIMNHNAEIVQPEKQIVVQSFSQRLNAWPNDDWTGIADSSQRRKLQNRVNQRVRRKLCPCQVGCF